MSSSNNQSISVQRGSCGPSGCVFPQEEFTEEPAAVINPKESLITVIDPDMLQAYDGEDVASKIDSIISENAVVIVGWSHCPYCLDVRETLSQEIGVRVHVVETDEHEESSEIQKAIQKRTGSRKMPYCFINGTLVGGCDDVRTLQASGQLDQMLGGLIEKQVTLKQTTSNEETPIPILPVERGNAVMPLLWFPPTCNHNVIRVSGCLTSILSAVSVVLVFSAPSKKWGQGIAAYLVGDFFLRFCAGASLSMVSQVAVLITATKRPDFRPGPPKQFASSCGLLFATLATVFYFTGLVIPGAVFMAMLAMASGMEGFGDFCLGCFFFSKCIRFGLVPDYVYRVHSASRPELIATWDHQNTKSKTAQPLIKVVTDPESKVGLSYKIKSDEWIKDDFDVIRNMQALMLAMPMSLAGLATAFKLASEWGRQDLVAGDIETLLSVPEWWAGVFGILGAIFFAFFLVLYAIRVVRYPHKCAHEWNCPLRSCHFGYITTSLILFSYLLYNWDGPLGVRASEWTARCLLWLGAVAHSILVVTKIGEFVGLLHDVEHIHTTWLMLPVGSMAAAFVAPLVPMLDGYDVEANAFLAQFFFSFAFLLWISLFVITFLKVVTTPNSNNAQRNTIFMWVAAPCTVGLANYSICVTVGVDGEQCSVGLAQYYFVGVMMFLCLAYAAIPYINFFGRDPFSMEYWSGSFAFGMLAACGALVYGTNGYPSIKILMLMALTVATLANSLALLHTLTAIRRRKVFTPTPKWGPLAFMKCTHAGVRGAILKLRASLEQLNLLDTSNQSLYKFATLFAQFRMVHEEHSRHENQVIFKTFSEYFPSHCDKYTQDHADDETKLARWSSMVDTLLDPNANASEKDTAYEHLSYNIPEFLDHQLVHMQGEEDHLQPIGKKYIPITLQKQMVKECYQITSSSRWEAMLPYIINNCPHNAQRVRYLKCLCWAMPERSQQIGAIVYRHMDAVMWERLRVEIPEIVPRGDHGWRRYY